MKANVNLFRANLRMEKFLCSEVERLKRVLNNVPAGIEVYDNMGKLLEINRKGLDIFGVQESSMVLGINILDNPNLPKPILTDIETLFSLTEKKKRAFVTNHFKDSFAFDYSFDKVNSKNYFPTRYHHKVIYLSSKIECYFDEKGAFSNLILIFLDETEHYQEQMELKKFKLMFDNMSSFGKVGIMEENITDQSFVANDQWFENFGVTKDCPRNLDDIYNNLIEEDRLWLRRNYLMIPYVNKPFNIVEEKQFEVVVEGRSRWIKCVWHVFEDEYGDTIILGSSIDVTEFVEATLHAKESDKLKTKFLENITHEIHTPLNAIVGFSQLLVDTESSEERKEYKKIIAENNDLLVKLVNNILDYSKVEAGILTLDVETFDACALAYDLFEVYQTRHSNSLSCNFKTNSENILIYSDKKKVKDILTNLLSNAFKFTSEGFVDLSVEDMGEYVRFSVKDSGIGIGEEQQKKIFERFFKLNDFSQGSGLGLSIAQKLVKLMGGNLKINSEFGKGSEFYFLLPKKKD